MFQTMSTLPICVIVLLFVVPAILISVEGLAASSTRPIMTTISNSIKNRSSCSSDINNNVGGSRRAFVARGSTVGFGSFFGLLLPSPSKAEQVLGRGLDASLLDEPSISYKDFLDKLTKGEVVFVEFLAPDGDVAYATVKVVEETTTVTKGEVGKDGEEGQPITTTTSTTVEKKLRIGEGYPIELRDGISSPLFCIKAVKAANVPYKFTVKGLSAMVK
mmetsp:Transcript_27192/g.31266  ORF Transcript_27192/g.31266 Transcript_27192/m.31266 type:complete len:218 (-) Transcript_27192:76-729(-)